MYTGFLWESAPEALNSPLMRAKPAEPRGDQSSGDHTTPHVPAVVSEFNRHLNNLRSPFNTARREECKKQAEFGKTRQLYKHLSAVSAGEQGPQMP